MAWLTARALRRPEGEGRADAREFLDIATAEYRECSSLARQEGRWQFMFSCFSSRSGQFQFMFTMFTSEQF